MVELEGRRSAARGRVGLLAVEPRLLERFERLERARAELVGRLSGIDEETLNRRPRDDAWSVVQVLHHVMLAEDLSVAYIERRLGEAGSGRAGLMERLRSWALTIAMRSPFRFTAPPMAAEVPERDSLRNVAARWEENRDRMREVFARIPAEAIDRAVYRHPVMGMMSIDHAVRFLEEHLAHHERQIDRTLEAVESTAS